mgnify:CR=1 FL=1
MRVISICLALLSTPVAAHEYWIEPLDWQIGANDKVQARLVNGSDFVGIEFPDGSIMGDTGNVKLRFNDSYMQMAADGEI